MESKIGIFTAKKETATSWEIYRSDEFIGFGYQSGNFECGGKEILLTPSDLRELADFIENLKHNQP